MTQYGLDSGLVPLDDVETTSQTRRAEGMIELQRNYAQLPNAFHAPMNPVPVTAPRLIAFNRELAEFLGLDMPDSAEAELAALFGGNAVPEGARPVAMAYAGHQFGNFVPQLGDGRAVLLGEVEGRDGLLRDVHLKGAGATPFSRGGDGRSALGPVIREYLVSEAMHALGVPTTRALAAVTTGEYVQREQPVPGGILARVARSHVRVGTFQYFAARGDTESLRVLVGHVVDRLYPAAREAESPVLDLLARVVAGQAALVARWLSLGFVHGVMNTDNMAVSGETIDFGPCAFMEAYDPDAVWSSIDRRGRYAFSNQPRIALWNLARLAETLLPLIDDDQQAAVEAANAALEAFPKAFDLAWLAQMRVKLGLNETRDGDVELVQRLLDSMHAGGADFTLTFRHLADAVDTDAAPLVDLFSESEGIAAWLHDWRARLDLEGRDREAAAAGMRAVNPAMIPRNHRVEQAIRAAEDHDDFSVFDRLRTAWQKPFDAAPDDEDLMRPAASEERVLKTFCGT